MHDVLTVSCTTVQVDILSTISNVADGQYLADTRGHETHDSGKREDDARGFRSAKTSRRETLARCRDDKFRDRARPSEDCCPPNAQEKKAIAALSYSRARQTRTCPNESIRRKVVPDQTMGRRMYPVVAVSSAC